MQEPRGQLGFTPPALSHREAWWGPAELVRASAPPTLGPRASSALASTHCAPCHRLPAADPARPQGTTSFRSHEGGRGWARVRTVLASIPVPRHHRGPQRSACVRVCAAGQGCQWASVYPTASARACCSRTRLGLRTPAPGRQLHPTPSLGGASLRSSEGARNRRRENVPEKGEQMRGGEGLCTGRGRAGPVVSRRARHPL